MARKRTPSTASKTPAFRPDHDGDYPGKPGPKPDFSWHDAFIESMARLGNVSAAARAAGVERDQVYEHQKKYPSFAHRWARARETATELLEQEATRRALTGVDVVRTTERVNADGSRVLETVTERKVSDQLLIFLLKANKPEKYRERPDLAGALAASGEPLTIKLAFDPTPQPMLADVEQPALPPAGYIPAEPSVTIDPVTFRDGGGHGGEGEAVPDDGGEAEGVQGAPEAHEP